MLHLYSLHNFLTILIDSTKIDILTDRLFIRPEFIWTSADTYREFFPI